MPTRGPPSTPPTPPTSPRVPAPLARPTASAVPEPPLPRLYVIGDSISLHYGPYLERFVAGSLSYARKQEEAGPLPARAAELDYPNGAFGENAGDSGMVLEFMRARLGALPADYVLLNCGLHDLKTSAGRQRHQVGIDEYRDNLAAIVALTDPRPYQLLWATTTPVHDATHAAHAAQLGFGRRQADVERYNHVATSLMQRAGVRVVDLHAFTSSLAEGRGESDLAADLYADHVHFVDPVRQAQAAFLAGYLIGNLPGSLAPQVAGG